MNTQECNEFLETIVPYRQTTLGCRFFPSDMDDLLEVIKRLKGNEEEITKLKGFVDALKQIFRLIDEDVYYGPLLSECSVGIKNLENIEIERRK